MEISSQLPYKFPKVCNNSHITNPQPFSFKGRVDDDSFDVSKNILVNPITNKQDINFHNLVENFKYDGYEEPYNLACAGLDSKGIFSPIAFDVLDIFYTTKAEGVKGFVSRIKELVSRYISTNNFYIYFSTEDGSPIPIINSLKNSNGDFEAQNKKFLCDLLKAGAWYQNAQGINATDLADLINTCKDENGVVDERCKNLALNLTHAGMRYGEASNFLDVYFKIPHDNSLELLNKIMELDCDPLNKLKNFPNVAEFCFDENWNINEERFELYKEMVSIKDIPYSLRALKMAAYEKNSKELFMKALSQSDNIEAEVVNLIRYYMFIESYADETDFFSNLASKYFDALGTYENFSDFFVGCTYDNTDENLSFSMELFDDALELAKLGKELKRDDSVLIKDIPALILRGELRVETLPFSVRGELLSLLNEIYPARFDDDSLYNTLIDLSPNSKSSKIAYDITNYRKNEFTKEILASSNEGYTNFENVMIAAIPMLENFEEGLPLYYSRIDLLEDIYETAPSEDRFVEVTLKMGIEINSFFENDGHPAGYDGFIDIDKLDVNDEYEKKVYEYVLRYFFDNQVVSENPEFNKYMNLFIGSMPEFLNIVGKQQHQTQAHTLDIHSLLVLAYSLANFDYLDKLSPKERTIIKMSTMLHDIAKRENIVDNGHQYLSCDVSKSVISKFFKHPEICARIDELICNHHWLGGFSTKTKGFSASEIAVKFRRFEDFEIAKIMAVADLKAVSPEFYERLKDNISQEKIQPIEDNLSEFRFGSNIYYTDRFVNKQKLRKFIQTKDGVEYKVVNLKACKSDDDVSKFGFRNGAKKKDLLFAVHMVKPENIYSGLTTAKSMCNPQNDGILSESIINLENTRTYRNREHGLILSHNPLNILVASNHNLFSGYKKDLNSFVPYLVNKSDISDCRNEFLTQFAKELGISEIADDFRNDYLKLVKNCLLKISSIEDINPSQMFKMCDKEFSGQELINILKKIHNDLFSSNGHSHNEIITYLPRIEAVISKSSSLEEVPDDVLLFAKENDLPIVLM